MKYRKGKVIRDSVHGDIFIEDKYMNIINTKEFQRLRRIKQLSVGNLVFPSAEHTRFSHCIGTFYLMKKIINHLEMQFASLNLIIDEHDKDLALIIALIHDIGHGPFSHAFENIINKKHEEWTKDIILGDTEVNNVLKENFGENVPDELAQLLDEDLELNNRSIKGKLDLFSVIKSLFSSQLDADRLDYLLRDSQSTGVSLGIIDVSRIINSISLTEFNNKIYVCVNEKNLIDIKSYLLARDDMNEAVYFHPIKCEIEEAIRLFFDRCKELYNSDERFKQNIPSKIKCLFSNEKINLQDYLNLDDYNMTTFIKSMLSCDDIILKTLGEAIINRRKFRRINILNNSEDSIKQFTDKLNLIIKNNVESQVNEKYYLLKSVDSHIPYKKDKEQLYILKNDGDVKLISDFPYQIDYETKKVYLFVNIQLIKELIKNNDDVLKNVENLIDLYDNKNHIEIEKKFIINPPMDANDIMQQIKSVVESMQYKIDNENYINQKDSYYDTNESYFYKNKSTCRIREKDNHYYCTIKQPAESIDNGERFELEFKIENNSIQELMEVMHPYINEQLYSQLENSCNVMTIETNRHTMNISLKDIKFELALDRVKYIDINKKVIRKDCELEIELKSNYIHKVALKFLADKLQEKIPALEFNLKSKYDRGMSEIDTIEFTDR